MDAERATIVLDAVGAEITPARLRTFANAARRRLRGPDGGCRRDHLRALAQRVEVADGEVRIMGPRRNLLRTLAAAGDVNQRLAARRALFRVGGGSGIRTHGTLSRTHAFQACALNHSAIPPA